RDGFFDGARATGTSQAVIEELWAVNEAAADYSFNKSHAACYALISYRTAWLKATYPAEYMAALISSVMSTKDKVPFFVTRCEEMGIDVLPPDVNESNHDFVVTEGRIRFGLDAVKGVGYQAVEAIKDARNEGGEFRDLWDFCARVDGRCVNKKAIEALIKCGAFGSTGATRKGMLQVLEAAQAAGSKAQQDALIGQGSIFDLGMDLGGDAAPSKLASPSHAPIPDIEFERSDLLAAEKEAIGLFISAHPLKEVGAALQARVDCSLAEVSTRRDGDWVTVGGMITQAKKIRTKKGDPMMFATLDDLSAQVEIIVFGKTLATNEADLEQDSIVTVRGRVDHKDKEKVCLIAQQVERFDPTPEEVEIAEQEAARVVVAPTALRLALDATALPASVLGELKDVLAGFPGDVDVVIELRTTIGPRRLKLGPDFRVARTAGLHAELHALLGQAIIRENSGAPEAVMASGAA
ncbi:MAG: polymerase subunit alpha, partial [Solirubrobacteraceae bacterium]|nr:polymerase subunit alpha [Solirubrobacteraceae bacterium]